MIGLSLSPSLTRPRHHSRYEISPRRIRLSLIFGSDPIGGWLWWRVWQGLDRHPFYQTLHDVSQQQFGKSSVQTVFSLGNANELRTLLTASGFGQVEIEPMSITAHFPQPKESLLGKLI